MGDQSVNVSDTIPYPGQLLESYEEVLLNESNSTRPIQFSIGETGVNKRIVFELYKYQLETGRFNYEGNWVQLWVNVTEPR